MFRVSPSQTAGDQDGGDSPQPLDDLSRFVEPPHMCIAGRESAQCMREARSLLQRGKEDRRRILELVIQKMCYPEGDAERPEPIAWAKAQRRFVMFYRDTGLADDIP